MSTKFYLLKFIKWFLDYFSNLIFRLVYSGKYKKVSPVTNPLLLEPASTLVKKIIKQQLSSVDIVKAYIARIKEVQPIINAVTDDRFEDALKDAKQADELVRSQKYSEEELEKKFPLLGIPLSVKEHIAVKDMLNTAGLYAKRGTRALNDAESVALLRKAGAIPLTVTNMPELCAGFETCNKIYGRTLNPYDTRRIVGGSSGGEGALLAAGGSLIGIGSDLGGSVRLPAFFNGVFAHKPTARVTSIEGMIPAACKVYDEFFSIGPMCRYATDLLPMLKVLSNNITELALDEKVDISKLKIYYMENDGGNPLITPVNSELVFAQKQVFKYFEEKYKITPKRVNLKKLKWSLAIWSKNIEKIQAPSLPSLMADNKGEVNMVLEIFKCIFRKSDFTLLCIVFALFEKFNFKKSSKDIPRFITMAKELKHEFENMLGDDGIFLYPSFPENEIFHNQTIFKLFNASYTAIFNILGLPVTQCPLGLSSEGLPLGIQVVGGTNKDRLTISVAMELEKAFGGWKNPSL